MADQPLALIFVIGSVIVLAIALVIEHRRPVAPSADQTQAPMSEREQRYHGDDSWGR